MMAVNGPSQRLHDSHVFPFGSSLLFVHDLLAANNEWIQNNILLS
jgi:hypothetical protein